MSAAIIQFPAQPPSPFVSAPVKKRRLLARLTEVETRFATALGVRVGVLARLLTDARTIPLGHVLGDDARDTLREWGFDVAPPAAPLLRLVPGLA